ncbi:MAG: hypothetical protein JNK15_02115 [Planctomycetes bacterium]|nr:hypothetical protein [Planctomycetota bacterium]
MTFADPSPWLAVFGRAHPVLLHAPLGLLPGLALLEFGAVLLRRPPPRGAVLALAWLCALTAAAAAASGLVWAGESNDGSPTLGQHKIAGLVLAGLCLVVAVLAFASSRGPFRIALVLACAAMFPTGHLGGEMTHGSDFLFAPLRDKKPPAKGPGPDGTPPPASEYTRTIAPILDRVCTSCHNPDKQKGELLLTTPEGIRKGGENGAVVVAGKPDESPLLARCLLPLDHDDHMPPAEKKQPTADELAALRAWIEAGAGF